MIKSTSIIRVRYADTDKMEFVYNGKYLEYFEVGRTELLRKYGLPYFEIENMGYQLPLIEARVFYKLPAVYDDLLEIEARVDKLLTAKIHIDYLIKRKNTTDIITEGYTVHMFIKKDTKKPVKPPSFYIQKLSQYF